MRNDFEILARLLRDAPSEVEGRNAALEPELREKLERLVRGDLSDEQRRELCSEIVGQDAALILLARLMVEEKAAGEPAE
jgi:hypothetical protein